MKTYLVEVLQTLQVTIDETKFDEAFMEEFRELFFNFNTIEDHVEHLAQLYVRGLAGDFIEGYGTASEMGIEFEEEDLSTEIINFGE